MALFARPRAATRLTLLALALLLVLALLPQIAAGLDDPFLIRIGIRIMILAIAALSLNLILGYGGMVSLGHAAFIGVAAYAVAILNFHASSGEPLLTWPVAVMGSANAFIVWPVTLAVVALAALLIGAVSLRTTGLYFIMITLGFAQMLYYLAVSFQKYGGEDGLQLALPVRLGGFSLASRLTLYYLTFGVLLAVIVGIDRLVRSRFGMVLQGCRQNERRLVALGFPTYRYRLAAFVVAGAIAGLAGVLLASAQQFVSPSDLAWSRSGELVIILVLGGVGTLFGPLLGAVVYVMLELLLNTWTTHWQLIFGPVFILFVLFIKGGLAGLVERGSWRRNQGG